MEDKHLVAGIFQDSTGVLDARRRDAEHRGGDERAVRLRIADCGLRIGREGIMRIDPNLQIRNSQSEIRN